MKSLIITGCLIVLAITQSCSLSDGDKVDCGYLGINQQQCQSKSCCWIPVFTQQLAGTPWCFYPSGSNPCGDINWNYTGGPGFTSDFETKMYALFLQNINIEGKGGVAAAPDKNTPGGSYFYHWMRDAGLTMRAFQELNDLKLSAIEEKMKAYVSFVSKVQVENDPYGNDVRINPKFELPNG
jgi:glucoamylase